MFEKKSKMYRGRFKNPVRGYDLPSLYGKYGKTSHALKRAVLQRLLELRDFQYDFKVSMSLKRHKACVSPRLVEVVITNACNLRCIMCDRWKWVKEDKSMIGNFTTQRLFALFEELSALGVKDVLLSGGEPMLRADFSSLIKKIYSLKMGVTLFTNGTLMNRENAKAIATSDSTVFFSIDGLSETHDKIRGVKNTFDRALKGIEELNYMRKLWRTKNRIIINFTVQRNNVCEVFPMFKAANKIGADAVTYNLVHGKPDLAPTYEHIKPLKAGFENIAKHAPSSHTLAIPGEMVQALIEGRIPISDVTAGLPALSLFKKNPVPCLAAYETSFIDSFGRVYPCCFIYSDNSSYVEFEMHRNRFYMGSVLEKSFSEIWYSTKYNKFRGETDPVNANDLGAFCGQCYEYYSFRHQNPLYRLLLTNS